MSPEPIAYEIVSLTDPADVHRIELHRERADKVFEGLIRRVDFERYWIRNVFPESVSESREAK